MSTPPRLFSTPLELHQSGARTTILGGLSPEPVPHTALLARAVGLSPEPVRAQRACAVQPAAEQRVRTIRHWTD